MSQFTSFISKGRELLSQVSSLGGLAVPVACRDEEEEEALPEPVIQLVALHDGEALSKLLFFCGGLL